MHGRTGAVLGQRDPSATRQDDATPKHTDPIGHATKEQQLPRECKDDLEIAHRRRPTCALPLQAEGLKHLSKQAEQSCQSFATD